MKKVFLSLLFLLCLIVGAFAYYLFAMPNINGSKRVYIKIATGSTYPEVLQLLKDKKILKSEYGFDIVSKLKKYPFKVKSGYYGFDANMNNRQLVNLLRAGLQTPVKLVIYNIRTKKEFAGLVGRTLEIDSNALLSKLSDVEFCKTLGVDTNKILSLFIVDNYDFYWNISLNKFLETMNLAYTKFWTIERREKAAALNLSPVQITTLASIVEREVIRDKELPTVAGVYLNRIKIGMPLQADPTLVFALRDFNARRVTAYHKNFDSPYNTYMYAGLPPGQICMPRKKSINAVLNYEDHQYLYFCANPDMSGYSIFSKTYKEQMKVAAQYRRKMDAMNVH